MIENLGWLLLWGTVVGLDLVSGPQVMIARPIVAGTVAGLIVGDPGSGAMVGAILELFALDVLPVGAVRYPDYGQGAVAAAAATAGAPGVLGIGVAVAVGLIVAYLGEVGIQLVRRRNTADVRRHQAALDEGDAAVISMIQWRGVMRDGLRALTATAIGLLLAAAVYRWPSVTLRGAVFMSVVVLGTGLAAAASGVMRLGGRGIGQRWFALGVAVGVGWVVLR